MVSIKVILFKHYKISIIFSLMSIKGNGTGKEGQKHFKDRKDKHTSVRVNTCPNFNAINLSSLCREAINLVSNFQRIKRSEFLFTSHGDTAAVSSNLVYFSYNQS